jgi:hypothetical protein
MDDSGGSLEPLMAHLVYSNHSEIFWAAHSSSTNARKDCDRDLVVVGSDFGDSGCHQAVDCSRPRDH